MQKQSALILLLVVSLLVASFSGLLLYLNAPISVKVAVGPAGSHLAAYVRAMSDIMVDGRAGFRVRVLETSGTVESSSLLDQGLVDLALLRSDDETSKKGRSLVVVHRKMLVILQRNVHNGDVLKTIRNGTGGMLRTPDATFIRIVSDLFNHYGLASSLPRLEMMSGDEAAQALLSGGVDYIVALAHPADETLHNVLLSISHTGPDQFDLVVPPGARGAGIKLRGLEYSELIEGILGGAPPLPLSSVGTLSVTYELVASSDYDERRAALFTKTLMEHRAQLRSVHDGGLRIEAPALDQARRFLPHIGAARQLAGEAESFLEAYSDVIWMVLFGLGFLGSALSGGLAILTARRRKRSLATRLN